MRRLLSFVRQRVDGIVIKFAMKSDEHQTNKRFNYASEWHVINRFRGSLKVEILVLLGSVVESSFIKIVKKTFKN